MTQSLAHREKRVRRSAVFMYNGGKKRGRRNPRKKKITNTIVRGIGLFVGEKNNVV